MRRGDYVSVIFLHRVEQCPLGAGGATLLRDLCERLIRADGVERAHFVCLPPEEWKKEVSPDAADPFR